MTVYYYVLLTLFAVLASLMVLDQNISTFIDIQYKLAIINVKRMYIMIRMYPRLMLDKWRFQRILKNYRSETNGRED